MGDLLVLGIETTCDETSAAVVSRSAQGVGEIRSNVVRSQIAEHSPYGGVVPEIAARAHVLHLDRLVKQAMEEAGLGFADLDGVAATAGPGLLGGVILLYMGYDVIRTRKEVLTSCSTKTQSPFWAGVTTTAFNPGWLLWWATVGAALTATAVTFGWWMLPFFALVHITCDFLWEGFVGMTIFGTKGKWSSTWHQRVIAGSGALMIVFALLFIYDAMGNIL